MKQDQGGQMEDASSLPRFQLDPAWFDAIRLRVSRRRFDGRPVEPEALERVERVCRRVSLAPDTNARAVLVKAAPDGVFRGLVGGYGGAIKGAPAFVAFLGKKDWQVDVGFAGEAVILEATAAGAETCWVAGSFDSQAAAGYVELAEGERVCAVTPVGRAAEVGGGERLLRAVVRSRTRLDLEQIAPGATSWPVWAREAAEAARLAPSGGNRQPWRLEMDGESLVLAGTTERVYWTWEMDCGIAALHVELGALRAGARGSWARLERPEIGRFTPLQEAR